MKIENIPVDSIFAFVPRDLDAVELNAKQAAAYVGLSRRSFYRTVKAGLIKPAYIYPFGGRRYALAALDAFKNRFATKQGYRRRAYAHP